MCCNCCGETMLQFMTVEHKPGTRKKYGHNHKFSGVNLYRWIIKNKFPSDFEILCMNCNFARGIFGKCPHEGDQA